MIRKTPFSALLIGAFICLLFSQCAPARFVKPLEKGQKAIGLSLGGPMILFAGMPIPIPFTTLSSGYGIDSTLTIAGGLHTTSALFGVVQADVSLIKEIVPQKSFRPGISLSPVVNYALDIWEGNSRFFPQFDVNFYWNYKQKQHYFYLGSSNWFSVMGKKGHDQKQSPNWVPCVQLGHVFNRPKMMYTIELKQLAPFTNNSDVVVNYLSLAGGKGATGVYFSVYKKF